MAKTLPPVERSSYIYEGNGQAFDHILVDAEDAARSEHRIFHTNTAGNQVASDHDPSILRMRMD
jgi:hypothetical protein